MHRADALIELCRHIFARGNATRIDFAVIEVGESQIDSDEFIRIAFDVDASKIAHSTLARQALNELFEWARIRLEGETQFQDEMIAALLQ